MKNITTILVAFLFFSLSINYSFAQGLTYKISLAEQVQNSTQIIEGKVISKQSFWDVAHQNIFTVNTIEVYKVFKGQPYTTIEIITSGGIVELDAEVVTPSLSLSANDIGVFMLHNNDTNLNRGVSDLNIFKPYSSLQGFYKYNLSENLASNIYNIKNGITNSLYPEIRQLVDSDFYSLNEFDVDAEYNNNTSRRGGMAISDFSPTTITAGTKSILTINGSGFGSPGTVRFRDANNGGGTFHTALDSQIISWTDNQIQVEIPSRAGTGTFIIFDSIGFNVLSTTPLTISYAEINVESTFGTGILTAYQTQHYDQNSAGGMTWNMQTDFNNNVLAKASFLRAFETWVCETGVNWINGSATGVDTIASDGTNIVRFDNGGELPNGILGVNTSYFSGCSSGGQVNWFVSELDITFNDTTNWQFGPANPSGGQVDFETVAVHELGHGHQIAHVINTNAIMHYAVSSGVSNRVLSADDIDAGNDIQNRSTTNMQVCGNGLMTNSSCSLSVSDAFLAENILIFPNPAKNIITIENPSFLNLEDVTFYDLNGRLIFNKDISNTVSLRTIDVSNLSNGMYFITISSDRGSITKKIIIE